jgi:DNA transposition AAA+ family ATPase
MARHFLELPAAQTLATTNFLLTQEAVGEAAATRSIVVIHGAAGSGKTYAVEHALSGITDVEAHWTVFPSRATQKRVVKQLLQTITGVPHDGDRYGLIDTALVVLSEKPRLIVIDEAQELSWDGIELLRHLWDDPQTDFGLALAGADGCWELIAKYPPLESRVLRRVAFAPFSTKDVVELMPEFHPLYKQTDPDTLRFVDSHFAHGNLRTWARFTLDADRLCAQRGETTLTQEVASAAFMLQRSAAPSAQHAPRTRAAAGRKSRAH